jgi:PTH1 family peptidyl-tRNA hydrolase
MAVPEAELDHLVVGLGNPGRRYASTRHNLGYGVVDRIAAALRARWRDKFAGQVGEARDGARRLVLLKPETYMNESGRSVGPAARFFKIPPERVVIVHDELDLELGDIRAKSGGGLAGHNGLRSVADGLGTPDFLRVRIGIGRPERGERLPVAEWVLRPFAPDVDVDDLLERGTAATFDVVRRGVDAAMREWNGRGPG